MTAVILWNRIGRKGFVASHWVGSADGVERFKIEQRRSAASTRIHQRKHVLLWKLPNGVAQGPFPDVASAKAAASAQLTNEDCMIKLVPEEARATPLPRDAKVFAATLSACWAIDANELIALSILAERLCPEGQPPNTLERNEQIRWADLLRDICLCARKNGPLST